MQQVERRGNIVERHNQPVAVHAKRSTTRSRLRNKLTRYKKHVWLALAVLLVVAGFVAYSNGYLSPLANRSRYQAVFLTSGQVYFGKLSGHGQYLVLKDVYYFQANNSDTAPASSDTQQRLIKLGSEVHSPESQMKINRDQILFFEDLKADSAVSKAISDGNNQNSSPSIQR